MTIKKLALGALLCAAVAVPAQARNLQVAHVLLISVDGLHALDVANYASAHPSSAIATLAGHGITYSNARTPANSDSFPGLLALVTGGSPLSHGIFYDYSYDRSIYAPGNTTCSGTPGYLMVYDESIDTYVNGISQGTIDASTLPRVKTQNGCVAQYPHSAVRTNTIFEVVRAHNSRTAWADKHPAYDLVNGPSGKGVVDLYTPEITNVGGPDATVAVECTVDNDTLKVNAIINEIDGYTHDRSHYVGTPALFGMNFQAVSVGQKLAKNNKDNSCTSGSVQGSLNHHVGGYTDGSGTPTDVLQYGLDQTDASLGRIIAELKAKNLYNSTLIVLTSKHGQSPMNPVLTNKVGHFGDLLESVASNTTSTGDAGYIALDAANIAGNATPPTPGGGLIQDDDIALIWLGNTDHSNPATVKAAIDYLNLHAKDLSIEEVMGGNDLKLKFNSPNVDSRTPDIIVQPMFGTIYTGSSKKNAEHGGFNSADTNVGLILSNPGLSASIIKTPVATSQVAPTILKALGLDPSQLQSVTTEATPVLPGL